MPHMSPNLHMSESVFRRRHCIVIVSEIMYCQKDTFAYILRLLCILDSFTQLLILYFTCCWIQEFVSQYLECSVVLEIVAGNLKLKVLLHIFKQSDIAFNVDGPCRPDLKHRMHVTNEEDHNRSNSIEEEANKEKTTNFNFKNSFFHDEFKVSEI